MLFRALELVDLGLTTELYVDALAELRNLGSTFESTFIRWMRPPGSRDASAMVAVPVLRLIRPRSSIITKNGLLETTLSGMQPPELNGMPMRPRLDG